MSVKLNVSGLNKHHGSLCSGPSDCPQSFCRGCLGGWLRGISCFQQMCFHSVHLPISHLSLRSLRILACPYPSSFSLLIAQVGDSPDCLHKAPSWGCLYDVLGWGSFSEASVWEGVIMLSRWRNMPCVRKTVARNGFTKWMDSWLRSRASISLTKSLWTFWPTGELLYLTTLLSVHLWDGHTCFELACCFLWFGELIGSFKQYLLSTYDVLGEHNGHQNKCSSPCPDEYYMWGGKTVN